MKSKLNIRRGSFKWTRFADLQSPQCEGWALANGFHSRDDENQFQFSFGAYGWTKVRVWAGRDCVEEAFEAAVEWLDDNAPGHLVSHEEFAQLCLEAAEELGVEFDPSEDYETNEAVFQAAEADLTIIGHTSLKHGSHIASHEWTVDEITR
jgi:hypothetical protein